MMNAKLLKKYSIPLIITLCLSTAASAADDPKTIVKDFLTPAMRIICMLYEVFKAIVGPIAILIIIIAGVSYISSWQDIEKRKKAKDRVQHVVIGLIIVLLAATLVELVGKAVDAAFTLPNCADHLPKN